MKISKLAVIIALVITGVGFLIISSSSDASHPHLKLKEFYERKTTNPTTFDNHYMTIYGNVKEGSIRKRGIKADFVITDGTNDMQIQFTGKTLLPDAFKDGAQASVDGKFDPEKNVFVADKVMAKCASKYQPNEMGQMK